MTRGADRWVRPAFSEDAAALARVQRAAMEAACRAGLGDQGAPVPLDLGRIEAAWAQAIDAPPSARHRVVSAGEGARIVGIGALAPAQPVGDVADGTPLGERPADLEIVALDVDPAAHPDGHGDRLLHALADQARLLGATRLVMWAIAGDDWHTRLLTDSGFGPSGLKRHLPLGRHTLTQHLWYTDLDDE